MERMWKSSVLVIMPLVYIELGLKNVRLNIMDFFIKVVLRYHLAVYSFPNYIVSRNMTWNECKSLQSSLSRPWCVHRVRAQRCKVRHDWHLHVGKMALNDSVMIRQGWPKLSNHGKHTWYRCSIEPRNCLCPKKIFMREEPKTWQGEVPMYPYYWSSNAKILT